MFFIHFGIWNYLEKGSEAIFIRYYLFLTILFMMVVTILSIMKKIYPNYIGFAFMGLVMVKLMMMFLIMNRLGLKEVPDYKVHFILPYLISLLLETLYAIKVIQQPDHNSTKDSEENFEDHPPAENL